MVPLINGMIFVFLLIGMVMVVNWLWDVGVQEMIVYTEQFLLEEARLVRVAVLPDVNSTKLWDRLELSLYYSGIRNYFPFFSGKVWCGCCLIILSSVFGSTYFIFRSLWKAVIAGGSVCCLMMSLLQAMRNANLRATEKYLLELLNVTESFAVTGEEPAAILSACSAYMKGPIGQALKRVEKYVQKGLSGRMVLEQLKISLEHPKWQEFMHNLNICSMYNSEYGFVFRSSRKSVQAYLTSKKERQSIKHTAQVEMGIITFLCIIIIWALSSFLMIPVQQLVWGSGISKVCTVYMMGIVVLFYFKIGRYEKE